MLLLEKPQNMFRYVVVTLSLVFLMSCEDEAPVSDFVSDSFFNETLDKLVAKIDGKAFFFDKDPTAVFVNPDPNVNILQIEFIAKDESIIRLRIPTYNRNKETYTINGEIEDTFEGHYELNNGTLYSAIAPISETPNGSEGVMNITVNTTDRIINGTFNFVAQLQGSSGGGRAAVRVTEGVITNLSY